MDKKQHQKFLDEIRDAESNLESIKAQFLRAAGWKYTSSTPGCFWLWFKEFEIWDGKDNPKKKVMISGNADFAIRVEQAHIY